ncbi:MAG: ribose-phosphate pyrophosphokinase, partial [Spirochaetales bacterium]|nr:ribose-phosphate pyrophosphokinase [Spirochaetales bacterium]
GLDRLMLCAPDKGAAGYVNEVRDALDLESIHVLNLCKERRDERDVEIGLSSASTAQLSDIEGKDVVIMDDMVRTGTTIIESCNFIRRYSPRRILFFVTHFYSSREGRINMNDSVIDEIVATSSIPAILNRDMQGRLRHKLVVLRISRWISSYILQMIDPQSEGLRVPLYNEDMSSKNPRWRGTMGPLFSGQ